MQKRFDMGRWGIIAVLLTVVVLGYLWGRHWMGGQLSALPVVELPAPADCELHRAPCRLSLPAGQLTVEFSEEPVPLQPFRIQLHTSLAIDAATADFQMVDMYMGVNRYALVRQSADVWSREAMLPVCATGRSDWLMYLRLEVAGVAYVTALPFEAAAARGGR
ncbi:MAG: hypothetical protein LPK58_06035 [Gammaproteobacteria bacterium]|nr:hypothetical protein [Gammaproteobacteria bacterium]